MKQQSVHHTYLHFQELPPSMRMLFTGTLIVLGCGYMFAMIYIFESHAGRDGDPSLSVQDLIIAYSGSKEGSRIEAALLGPMSKMLTPAEAGVISQWAHDGADRAVYDQAVKSIVDERCMSCHDGSNPHLPNLNGFENIVKMSETDSGVNISTLVRVSHIHLFGMTFIFFIMCFIFTHALVSPFWLKCVVVAIPFLSIILDVFSWYLTKIYEPFAWVVMISGAFMGVAFAYMWLVSFYQMWFYKLPKEYLGRGGNAIN